MPDQAQPTTVTLVAAQSVSATPARSVDRAQPTTVTLAQAQTVTSGPSS